MFGLGPDPADPSRILVRRVNQLRKGEWAYEEVTVSSEDGKEVPNVHSTMHKLSHWDLYKKFSAREEAFDRNFKASPQVTSVSMFYSQTGPLRNVALMLPSFLLGLQGTQYTIVENCFEKEAGCTWTEWLKTHNDKRDMVWYLRQRMFWG